MNMHIVTMVAVMAGLSLGACEKKAVPACGSSDAPPCAPGASPASAQDSGVQQQK